MSLWESLEGLVGPGPSQAVPQTNGVLLAPCRGEPRAYQVTNPCQAPFLYPQAERLRESGEPPGLEEKADSGETVTMVEAAIGVLATRTPLLASEPRRIVSLRPSASSQHLSMLLQIPASQWSWRPFLW